MRIGREGQLVALLYQLLHRSNHYEGQFSRFERLFRSRQFRFWLRSPADHSAARASVTVALQQSA